MGLRDGITLQKAQEALNRIRSQFEPEDGHLAIITPDRYDEAFDLMSQHFVVDEPISRSIGVTWSKEFEELTYDHLKDNVSICMINNENDEIMGTRISGLMKKSDPQFDPTVYKDEGMRTLFGFVTQKDGEVDLFNRLGVEEVFHFFALGVRKHYRQRHLGSLLLKAAVALAAELGYKAVKGEGTSKYSQRIYENAGFECIMTLPYDTYIVPSGKTIRDGSGEHTDTKIYVIKLP